MTPPCTTKALPTAPCYAAMAKSTVQEPEPRFKNGAASLFDHATLEQTCLLARKQDGQWVETQQDHDGLLPRMLIHSVLGLA